LKIGGLSLGYSPFLACVFSLVTRSEGKYLVDFLYGNFFKRIFSLPRGKQQLKKQQTFAELADNFFECDLMYECYYFFYFQSS